MVKKDILKTSAFGIVRIAQVPMRSQPTDSAEMVNQLLFGEHYQVIGKDTKSGWLQIINDYDGYEGWLDYRQHYEISEAYFEHINQVNYQITRSLISEISFQDNRISIVKGSIIPMGQNELFAPEESLLFEGKAETIGDQCSSEKLIEIALEFLNAPYLWGGRSPFGIDCSGFTQQIYRFCGLKLKRDASQQYQQGKTIDTLEESKVGDLLFFNNDLGKITHVGILLPDNQIIHASGKVRIDKITTEGIFNESINKYTHSLCGIRRMMRM
ncbi:MAG: NlpC/P60 family protein [Cyclobacteriaceae bacterium]|nr:C40 family peptidase [Cyclobacteriaceae bacterium]MCH8515717.1 NlpC/P60 family protein [Cyclobacteriaceae bacterium]